MTNAWRQEGTQSNHKPYTRVVLQRVLYACLRGGFVFDGQRTRRRLEGWYSPAVLQSPLKRSPNAARNPVIEASGL
jgi:hypothetical protein